MASFSDQIKSFTGNITGLTSHVTQYLLDGRNDVIARLEAMNPDILNLFTKDGALIDGNGFDLSDHQKILNVRRGTHRAVPVNIQYQDSLSDSESIYYALPESPGYFITNSRLYIKPDPANTSGNKGAITIVEYGAIDDSAGTIATFPSTWYHAVVLYAAKGILHIKLTNLREALPDDLDSDQTVFDIVSDFAFTNTGYFNTAPAAPSAATGFSGAIGDEGSIASFGQAPTYDAPEFTLEGNDYPSITAINLTKAGNALISLDAGDIEAPGGGAASVGDLGTAPDYTAPNLSTITSAAGTDLLDIVTVAGTLNNNTDQIDFSKWWDVLSELIEDEEDIELAQVQIQKISTYVQAFGGMLNQYQAETQNALNVFNEENTVYQANLQKITTNAQLTDAKLGRDLQEYSAQLQQHAQEINNAVTKYNTDNQIALDKWKTVYQNRLQQYSVDIQNALNDFNVTSAVYQANIQKSITAFQTKASILTQEGNNVLAAQSQQYSANLQRYGSELQQYQADVSKEIQLYGTNLGKALQLYQAVQGKDTLEYNWIQGQLQYVTQLYEQEFGPASMDKPENTANVGVTR
jgi:hypothetical protein